MDDASLAPAMQGMDIAYYLIHSMGSDAPIRRIGGKEGWYYAQWLWNIRGAVDRMIGGVGLGRGRRDPEVIAVGDVIDFWRVEVFEPDSRLRLTVEMKLPGRAWLDFEVTKEGSETAIRQTAIFDPVGVWGLIYWYSLYPVHQIIFSGMIREIGIHACQKNNRQRTEI